MLVTFTTKAFADITLFGDVALTLLSLMGHSATVPGAILAEDVPAALDNLKGAIEAVKAAERRDRAAPADDSDEPTISLALRALPLIQLLAAAARENCDVMWQ